jgi:hypothetical protein
MPRKRAWYEDCQSQIELAEDFILTCSEITKRLTEPQDREIASYRAGSNYKVIFESNIIENAGLSESETKQVVLENCEWNDLNELVDLFAELYIEFNKSDKEGKEWPEFPPIISYQGKKKGRMEVENHLLALLFAMQFVFSRLAWECYRTAKLLKRNFALATTGKYEEPNKKDEQEEVKLKPSAAVRWENLFPELFEDKPDSDIFSEKLIRLLHFTMARGLLTKSSKVGPGNYRIDNRTTDFVTL